MGYIVSSLITVGEDDQHQSFVYFLPARRFAYEWINEWMYKQFQEIAGRFGPTAVLIAPPPGQRPDRGRESLAREFEEALDWQPERATGFLHTGLPFLVVSRRPVRHGDDSVPFAAINLASLDEAKLVLLFDRLIEAISDGVDLVDRAPDLGSELAGDDPEDAYLFEKAIEIKPSIFGIGLNGNVILEWMRRRRDRHSRETDILAGERESPA